MIWNQGYPEEESVRSEDMKTHWWIASLAGMTCLMVGCSGKTASKPNSPNSEPSGAPTATVAVNPVTASPTESVPGANANQSFSNPMLPSSTPDKALPVPNLIPPTTSLERLPQVSVGRADPFATLPVTPTIIATAKAEPPAPRPQPAASSLPAVSVPAVSTLHPVPANPNQLPGLSAPAPVSLAQAIEISGVVEVGGKVNIIVKVPDEYSSRYVGVGEYLANGKVLVKRVEMGSEPVVVLEQNGAEILRSVGTSKA